MSKFLIWLFLIISTIYFSFFALSRVATWAVLYENSFSLPKKTGALYLTWYAFIYFFLFYGILGDRGSPKTSESLIDEILLSANSIIELLNFIFKD